MSGFLELKDVVRSKVESFLVLGDQMGIVGRDDLVQALGNCFKRDDLSGLNPGPKSYHIGHPDIPKLISEIIDGDWERLDPI
jgi:hypothetical protein